MGEMRMLLCDELLKKKYEAAFRRGRDEIKLNSSFEYVVRIRDDIASFTPLFGYQVGYKEVVWHSYYNVLAEREMKPLPTTYTVLEEDCDAHIVLASLIAGKLDFDKFHQGAKLLATFNKAPVKYFRNHLTEGYMFRELGDGSYDVDTDLATFMNRWLTALQCDFAYKELELTIPTTIVGRLRTS